MEEQNISVESLAEYIQRRIHQEHLPGFYFDVEDVEEIIKDYMRVQHLVKKMDDIRAEIKQLTGEDI